MYKVTYRSPEFAENVVEFIRVADKQTALDYLSSEEGIELIETIPATHDEVVAYEVGLKQGWQDHQEYQLIEERMKQHNGHVVEEVGNAVDKFICGVCHEHKSPEDLSGETVPVGTYETPWDVCKGCLV